jgi:hypothetical protein
MTSKYRISNEEEEMLFQRFPRLFPGGSNVNPMKSLMCFGIECRRGWLALITKLCEDIERVEIEMKLPPEHRCQVVQIKSKYGGLRYYTNGHTTQVDELIMAAEKESYTTCEYCGVRGELRNDIPWITTLCDTHYKEYLVDRFGSVKKYQKWLSEKDKD